MLPENFESATLVELNVNKNNINKLNSDGFVNCKQLKVLRVKKNKLRIDDDCNKQAFGNILKNSSISTLEVEGNLFNEKALKELDGYEEFENRRTKMQMKKD